MAEIGVIASGMGVASLGLQLMDGIRKLKQFWDEVKDAPEDMRYALEDLETLSLVLSDIRADDPDLPPIPSTTATKCLELCRRGADMLNTIVKDLNAAISKRRRIGGAKVVLKKDILEKFRSRLRDAQYMLILSRQTYSEALQNEYHKIQIETAQRNACRHQREFEELKVSITRSVESLNFLRLSKGTTVVASNDFDDNETNRSIKVRARPKTCKEIQVFQGKLKMPQWFSYTNYTWDFSGFQAPFGWTFSFRQYYTMDWTSPTWRCAENGDVSGLQVLFRDKKATPCDRSPWGETLLDTASQLADYDMCCFLLSQGADPNDSYSGTTLLYRASVLPPDTRFSLVLRLLYPVSDIYDPFTDLSRCHLFHEELAWILESTEPAWREWSFDDRMIFALRRCNATNFAVVESTTEIITMMLQRDQLNKACCQMTLKDYAFPYTFLSIELICMVRAIELRLMNRGEDFISLESGARKTDFLPGGRLSDRRCSMNIEMIERLIVGGSDVFCGGLLNHALCLETIAFPPGCQDLGMIIPVRVRVWLEILDGLNIDLLEYGKTEHNEFLHRAIELSLQVERTAGPRSGVYVPAHLMSFTYGPAVDDWKFWFTLDEPCEVYYQNFRLFWDLVEHPERGMPGAWYEDYY